MLSPDDRPLAQETCDLSARSTIWVARASLGVAACLAIGYLAFNVAFPFTILLAAAVSLDAAAWLVAAKEAAASRRRFAELRRRLDLPWIARFNVQGYLRVRGFVPEPLVRRDPVFRALAASPPLVLILFGVLVVLCRVAVAFLR